MIMIKGSRRLAVTSLAVLVVLLLSLQWVLADTSPSFEEWSTTFGGSGNDYGFSVQGTSDGGYIIAGRTSSFGISASNVYLVKTNSTGGMEWNTTFGHASYTDIGFYVQETSDGGYIVTGHTMSFGAGAGDVYLVKTDSQGREEWSRTFGGSEREYGWCVQETRDGGYIITGETRSFGAGYIDVYLVKTDSQGEEEWNRTFGGSGGDIGRSVQATSDGGYIIAGTTSSFGAGGQDVYLVKTDSQGREEWSRTFGGARAEWGHSIQETTDGGYIIAGYTESFWPFSADVYLVKTDFQGRMEWNRTFEASARAEDRGYSVQVTSDGGYIITGWTIPYGADFADVYLVKTDSDGNLMWNTTFGGSSNDLGWSGQVTRDGGYIITGDTMSFGAGNRDVYLVKVGSQGLVEETYAPSIVNLEAPGEVHYTETSFTVELTFSYEFAAPTEIRPRIKDVETGTWIAEEYETLVGEGTKTYSFELSAPDAAKTWELEADVFYLVEGNWIVDEGSSPMAFSVEVVSGDPMPWDWLLDLPIEYLAIIGLVVLILLILLLKWIF